MVAVQDLTQADLSRDVGAEVPEIYVLVAKHLALGFDEKAVGELLGLSESDWEELRGDEVFQKTLLLVKAEHARSQAEADLSYDKLEEVALKRLLERAPYEKETDVLLRVAALANKAQRRSKPTNEVLDPRGHGVRIPLTLSSRMVRKLTQNGEEQIIERSISTLAKPSFEDVDGFLHVSARPYMDKPTEAKNLPKADPTLDELIEAANR